MLKPLEHKNYESIPHLLCSILGKGDHFIDQYNNDLLTVRVRDKHDKVFVFEKYDGSNVGISKINDVIIPLVRSGHKASSSKYVQHQLFSNWVYKNIVLFQEMLNNGERIVGEWLIQAHGLQYNIIGDPIVFFDYFDNENNRKSYNFLKEHCYNKFELQIPRLLHEGNAIHPTELVEELNKKTDTIFPIEDNPEGMVYRLERDNKFEIIAKWIRPDYIPGRFLNTIVKNKVSESR